MDNFGYVMNLYHMFKMKREKMGTLDNNMNNEMLINIYEKSGNLMYVMNLMIYRIKITSLSKLSRCS